MTGRVYRQQNGRKSSARIYLNFPTCKLFSKLTFLSISARDHGDGDPLQCIKAVHLDLSQRLPFFLSDFPNFLTENPNLLSYFPNFLTDFPNLLTDFTNFLTAFPNFLTDFPKFLLCQLP